MKRKTRYALRLGWNVFRIPFMKASSLGKIKGSTIQLISPYATLRTDRGGRIELLGRSVIEEGTLIDSFGGNITLSEAFVNRNCTIVSMDKISIEQGVTIGPGVCIYDHDHNTKKQKDKPYLVKPVKIMKNVWIGANATILKGVTIGEGSVVAAGSVVTHDVAPFSVVGGIPAKVIKKKNENTAIRPGEDNDIRHSHE